MSETQTEFVEAGVATNQNAKVLALLTAYRGEWVSMPGLVRHCGGYAVHSRIADLRKLGYAIDNRVDRSTKPYKSYYRLN